MELRLKSRRKKPSVQSISPQAFENADGATLHFRLCHVCLHLNESTTSVLSCQKCNHALGLPLVDQAARELDADWDPFIDPPSSNAQQPEISPEIERALGGIAGLDVRW
jgi:hypothetical protein